jgi:hypothetical protein
MKTDTLTRVMKRRKDLAVGARKLGLVSREFVRGERLKLEEEKDRFQKSFHASAVRIDRILTKIGEDGP